MALGIEDITDGLHRETSIQSTNGYVARSSVSESEPIPYIFGRKQIPGAFILK